MYIPKEKKNMKITDAMVQLRLPNPATQEDLETRWKTVLRFDDRVLVAGYYFKGNGKPCWFGAVYEHLDDDLSCEGMIGIREVSDVEFMDEGHAIKWASEQD